MSGRGRDPGPRYTWDETKNQMNVDKHGYPFQLAPYAFKSGTPHTTMPAKSVKGDRGLRRLAVARVGSQDITTVYIDGQQERRIISMRTAKPHEIQTLRARNGGTLTERHSARTQSEIGDWMALGRRQKAESAHDLAVENRRASRAASKLDRQANQEKWPKSKRDAEHSRMLAEYRTRTEPIRAKYQPGHVAERENLARQHTKARAMTQSAGQRKAISLDKRKSITGIIRKK